MDALKYFFKFIGTAHELLHQLQLVGKKILVRGGSLIKRRSAGEVFLGNVNDRDPEEVGELQQITDLGFSSAVLVEAILPRLRPTRLVPVLPGLV